MMMLRPIVHLRCNSRLRDNVEYGELLLLQATQGPRSKYIVLGPLANVTTMEPQGPCEPNMEGLH